MEPFRYVCRRIVMRMDMACLLLKTCPNAQVDPKGNSKEAELTLQNQEEALLNVCDNAYRSVYAPILFVCVSLPQPARFLVNGKLKFKHMICTRRNQETCREMTQRIVSPEIRGLVHYCMALERQTLLRA